MVLTRELLVGNERYLSVPAALVLSVALQSARARLSVPWSVHWVSDAFVADLAGPAGGSPERAVVRDGEVRLDLGPRRHQRDHPLAVVAEARPRRLARSPAAGTFPARSCL
jgi:hypothetical protein